MRTMMIWSCIPMPLLMRHASRSGWARVLAPTNLMDRIMRVTFQHHLRRCYSVISGAFGVRSFSEIGDGDGRQTVFSAHRPLRVEAAAELRTGGRFESSTSRLEALTIHRLSSDSLLGRFPPPVMAAEDAC